MYRTSSHKYGSSSTMEDVGAIGVIPEDDGPLEAPHHAMVPGAGASKRGPRGMARRTLAHCALVAQRPLVDLRVLP